MEPVFALIGPCLDVDPRLLTHILRQICEHSLAANLRKRTPEGRLNERAICCIPWSLDSTH